MGCKLMQGAAALVLCIFGAAHTATALSADLPAIPLSIQKQLQLPEDKIDIGLAALTFAKEIYPHINVTDYSKRIDQLAERARYLIQSQGRYDPDRIIRALNTFFYQREGFRYDRSADAFSKIENHYLTGVLDTKQGTCFNLPMLYMAVAQRLGYPVYPVMAPDHVFLRFVSPGLKEQNIEATEGGGYSPDEDYIQRLNITEKGLKSGAYLRTLTYRQFLARLLETNAITLGRRGDLTKAIRYLERVIQIDPKSAPTYNSLRIAYAMKSQQAHTAGAFDLVNQYQDKAKQASLKAETLGYVRSQPLMPRGG
jgi:regulator of sirC expression with transglutaminase-like and TPR domain